MEQLQIAWGGVRDHWTDSLAQHDEEQHIRPIFERINVALPALPQMAQALQQAPIQCGAPRERSGL